MPGQRDVSFITVGTDHHTSHTTSSYHQQADGTILNTSGTSTTTTTMNGMNNLSSSGGTNNNNKNNYNGYGQPRLMISPSSNIILPSGDGLSSNHMGGHGQEENKGCCAKLDCERICSHCFFLFACLWFMLFSSMTRVVAILDIISHIIVYCIAIAASFDNFFDAVNDDIHHFKYARSCVDLLVIAVLRTILTYYLYAYKRQLDRQCVFSAFLVMLVSALYCVIKVFIVKTGILRFVTLFSLAYCISEWIVYTALRRRRILVDIAAQQEDHELESGIDIESGAYFFTNPAAITHPNGLTTTAPPKTSSGDYYQTYQSPVSPTKKRHNPQSPDGTTLDSLGSTYTGDTTLHMENNASAEYHEPKAIPEQQQALPVAAGKPSRREVGGAGARRHKSTQNARIGNVSTGLSLNTAQTANGASNTNLFSPSSNSILSSPTPSNMDDTTQNDVFKPFQQHPAVQYAPSVSDEIQKLLTNQSQFLLFENIRIHYKFIVNPCYQDYYNNINNAEYLKKQDASTIPPVLVLIHGFLSTTYNFESFVQQFLFNSQFNTLAPGDTTKPQGNHSYSAVLIFDRPGFGLSAMVTKPQLEQRIVNYNNYLNHNSQMYYGYNNKDYTSVSTHRYNHIAEKEIDALLQKKQETMLAENGQTTPLDASQVDANTGSGVSKDNALGETYDFYPLIKEVCDNPNPYHPHFSLRLLTIFSIIYKFQTPGFVIGAHHSGATVSLAIALHLNLLYNTIQTKVKALNTKNNINMSLKNPLLGLVLICCSIYDDGFPPLLQQLFSNQTVGQSMVTSLIQSECSTVAIKRAFFNPQLVSPLLLALYKRLMKVYNRDEALYAMVWSESSEYHQQYLTWVKTNSDLYVTQPVLLIHGENDKLIPLSSTYKIIRTLLSNTSSIQCVRINACGHFPFHEAAETSGAAMNSFGTGVMKY